MDFPLDGLADAQGGSWSLEQSFSRISDIYRISPPSKISGDLELDPNSFQGTLVFLCSLPGCLPTVFQVCTHSHCLSFDSDAGEFSSQTLQVMSYVVVLPQKYPVLDYLHSQIQPRNLT